MFQSKQSNLYEEWRLLKFCEKDCLNVETALRFIHCRDDNWDRWCRARTIYRMFRHRNQSRECNDSLNNDDDKVDQRNKFWFEMIAFNQASHCFHITFEIFNEIEEWNSRLDCCCSIRSKMLRVNQWVKEILFRDFW